jgi:hypothetical protein
MGLSFPGHAGHQPVDLLSKCTSPVSEGSAERATGVPLRYHHLAV